jgi:hypothetical protein
MALAMSSDATSHSRSDLATAQARSGYLFFLP